MRRNRSCGLFVFAAAALLAGCGKRDERLPAAPPVAQQASLPVTNFAPPVRPTVPDTPLLPETVAELQGSAETPVLAKDSGYLVKQVYRENAIVAAGDLLFVIDPRPFHPDAPGSGHDDAGLIKIVAPARGAMSRALRGAGDWVNAGDELSSVATVDRVNACFSLANDANAKLLAAFDVIQAQPIANRPANIELLSPDGSIYPQKGIVTAMMRDTRNTAVAVTFPNPSFLLRPGEFVKVREVAP